MLLPRAFRVLGPEHRERPRDFPPPRLVRLDHVVDIAALGRDERSNAIPVRRSPIIS
jgi:hypothetical protein